MQTSKSCYVVSFFLTLILFCLQYFLTNKFEWVQFYNNVGKMDDVLQSNNSSNQTTPTLARSLEEDFKINCSGWKIHQEWNNSVKPQISLDPDRFLYPGLIFGPNNMVVGFKQSIYLAIKLNRTLVLPVFMAHYSSRQPDRKMSPFQVIDVDRLRRFVSCVSISTMRRKCNGAFDVALQAMQSKESDVQRFESDTRMEILDIKKNLTQIKGARELQINGKQKSNIPTLPNANYSIGYAPWLSSDTSIIQKVYGTSARCAIHASTFGTIRVGLNNKLAVPLEKSVTNISNIANNVLYSAVSAAVKHSPCIVEAARAYIKHILKDEEYIGVHWRYDSDWRKCCDKDPSKAREKMCKGFIEIIPLDLANALNNSLKSEKQFLKQPGRNVVVYIAMPPSMNDFKESTYKELKTVNEHLKKPSHSLESFINKNYKTCWEQEGWKQPSEILSMIEMEIMIQSTWFFQSWFSTWSSNIMSQRIEKLDNGLSRMKYTASVFDVTFDAMKKRTTKLKLEKPEKKSTNR